MYHSNNKVPHPLHTLTHPSHTQVLLYNGQLDIVVGPTLTERMLQVLDWSGKEDYLKADRMVCIISCQCVYSGRTFYRAH